MRFRTTAILLIVFALLAGYVFFVELKKAPAATPEDTSTWVLTLANDDVQKLTLEKSGSTLVLARSGDVWFIGNAGGTEADSTRVGSIVSSLVDLRSARVLTNTTESLAAFGLDKPALTVTLGLQDNKQEVLYIGAKNPQGSQYYLQKKDAAPIHLVYASLVDDLTGLLANPPLKPTPTVAPSPTSPSVAAPVTPGATP